MNLILIDDETKTRRGLLEHVNWFALGFTCVKAAANAREALAFCEHWLPSVVISDVRMPEMDGLELCRRLRLLAPDCQIMFISGYDDVESLRVAIDLSAVSFLHKPFEIGELEEKTRIAVKRYTESLRIRGDIETLFRNQSAIEQDTLLRLVGGEDGLDENLHMLGLNEEKAYQLALFKTPEDADASLCGKLRALLAEACPSAPPLFCKPDATHALFLLVKPREERLSALAEEKRLIEENVRAFNACESRILCAVSRVENNVKRLCDLYRDAQAQLTQLFWGEYGDVSFSRIAEIPPTSPVAPDLHAFEDAVAGADGDLAQKRAGEVRAQYKLPSSRSISLARKTYRRMAVVLYHANESLRPNSDADLDGLLTDMESADTLSAVHALLMQRLQLLLQPYGRYGDVNRTVWQTLKYIREHLDQPDLSVVELAEQVYLTPTYLSGLFKRETGQTVGRVILQARMELARSLLRDPSLKLYQVAEKCGYLDANYFAKLFKKATGVSPSEYRESRK